MLDVVLFDVGEIVKLLKSFHGQDGNTCVKCVKVAWLRLKLNTLS